ncbi:uncharacterized protein At4g00950-like isoform X2 [Salvia hispanica]|uniref:uncharacterized protein At4g00950-like isoform X2 n=1 Tax=Salvia hispanica TaxID=49212 RepID=UPI0020092B10|nr:uncharacterized protein At4g00950-like isoform X2 [Salvia hispanica]
MKSISSTTYHPFFVHIKLHFHLKTPTDYHKKRMMNEACFPTLKLPFAEIPDSAEHPSTPPFQASATIPFKWEEQPGKPRPCSDIITRPKPAKSLELPPCMADKFTKTPSPTTVLDGPYSVGRPKFSSFRFFRDGPEARGLFGKFKGGKTEAGSCRFSPSTSTTSFCHGIKQVMHWKGKKSNKEGRHSRVDNVS